MKTYLYKIENQETKEFYLGVRSCKCEITDDPYMGSSSKWNKEYVRVNRENLIKTIVQEFEDRTEANKGESDLIELHILDPLCVNRYIPKYYKDFMRRTASEETRKLQSINNSRESNPFFGKTHTPEVRKKLSKARKERITLDTTREKLSIIGTGEGNNFYGKHHTEENKIAHSRRMKGTYMGEDNAFFGKTHSEESKKLMSEAKKGANNSKSRPTLLENSITGETNAYVSFTELCLVNEFSKIGAFKALKNQKIYLKKYLIKYVQN